MKRFYWILALPYVVVCQQKDLFCRVETSNYDVCSITFNHRQEAEDLAASLNEAHERRINTLSEQDKAFLKRGHESVEKMKKEDDLYWKDSKKAEWESPAPMNGSHVSDKEACGQSDCGADPK